MLRNLTAAVALAVACLIAPVPAASAQADAGVAVRVNLRFEGGTVLDFIGTLRDAAPDANILCDEQAARVPMAAVDLKNTTLYAALNLLDEMRFMEGENITMLATRMIPSGDGGTQPIFHIRAESRLAGAEPALSKVWTVAALIEGGVKAEDLLTAIEQAVALQPLPEPAQIRFHAETGLLLVRANPSHVVVIDEVISQLHSAQAAARDARQSPATEQLRAQAMEFAAEREALAARSLVLEGEIERLRRMLEQVEGRHQLETSALRLELDQARRASREAGGGNP